MGLLLSCLILIIVKNVRLDKHDSTFIRINMKTVDKSKISLFMRWPCPFLFPHNSTKNLCSKSKSSVPWIYQNRSNSKGNL